MSDLGTWSPLDPQAMRDVMAGYGRPWWIAGGWALDLFLGQTTREHADIDLELLRSDQLEVQAHLREWELYLASDGQLSPWVAGEPAPPDVTDIWCRPTGGGSWAFQLMFNPGTPERWASKRSPMVGQPTETAIRRTADGLAYLAPELQLLMKAKAPRPKDEVDLTNLLPALDERQLTWLRDALEVVHPGHPWIVRLD